MKASIYIVLWGIILFLLFPTHSKGAAVLSFFVAVLFVKGVSLAFKAAMADEINFEKTYQGYPILEDVYSGNVIAFSKRLTREMKMAIASTLYFVGIFAVCTISMIIDTDGVNGWPFILFNSLVFGRLYFWTHKRCIPLIKAKVKLTRNPTPQQCMEIAENLYKLDYAAFYEEHADKSYPEMLPEKSDHFGVYIWSSIICAGITVCIGISVILWGGREYLLDGELVDFCFYLLVLLYGSLAVSLGWNDLISSILCKRATKEEPYRV